MRGTKDTGPAISVPASHATMKPVSRTLLLAFSALGIGASTAASYVHYKLLTDPAYASFCDVSAHVNCTQAYSSQYGSFMGVPVAPLGLLYFAFVFLVAALGARKTSALRDTAPAYIFLVSTIALAFILYLAWASYFVLKVFCILCALTYVSVIAIFIVSGGASALPMTTLPGRAPRDLKTLASNPMLVLAALLLVGGAISVLAFFPRDGAAGPVPMEAVQLPTVSDAERAKLAQWWEMQPKVDVPVPDGGAKVLVVKFNDYQCPGCKYTHDAYKPVWAKHAAGGQVRYVVKHYPLEGECNASAAGGNHYASCEAAAGVVMARAKGTAARFEDWIFANLGPPVLTPAQVREGAKTVGGITDFDAQYARALEEVKTDAGLGKLLKIDSTPTFFINGRMVPTKQILPAHYFDAIIELELQK
jgi:uncharacterized membrane protein/protein-disulfide isomerase